MDKKQHKGFEVMSDLVKDLRDGWAGTKALTKAADLIEQQQARISELELSATVERGNGY